LRGKPLCQGRLFAQIGPMRLFFVVAFLVMFTSEAQAQSTRRTSIEVPPVRMAVVIVGPQALVNQVQEEITLPLSAVAQIVQTSDYRRAAAHIGIARHPRSNRAAPFVGRELGAQYVLLVDGLVMHSEAGRQVFMGVRLIHTASAQMLLGQRYFLPDGKLTPSTADAIRTRLVQMVGPQLGALIPESVQPQQPVSGGKPQPAQVQPEQPMQPVLPAPQGALHPPKAWGKRPSVQVRAQAQNPTQGPTPRKSWVHLAPQLLWRRAFLKPTQERGQRILYGDGPGFGRVTAGGQLGMGFYFGRYGAEFDVAATTGATSETIDGVGNQSTAQRLSVRGAFAVELLKKSRARIAPRVGMLYDLLPIDLGPFIGLRYLAATVGARLATPLWGHILQLEGAVDYMFVGSLGLEAGRAGVPGFAQGGIASLGPVVWFGPVRLAVTLGLDTRTAHFHGPTSLYAPVRYVAMQLSDTLLQLAWQVGMGF
jgi:hypothetical protein